MPDTSPATRTFLDSGQAGQIHAAWDTSACHYDPVKDKYVDASNQTQTIRSVAKAPTAKFLEIMKALQDQHKKDAAVASFDIRGSHSWDEVMSEAGKAAEKYQKRAKGIKGLVPWIGRKVGDWNPSIEPILQILPSGDYTSIVCGGLILIFRAFKRMADVREQVISALGDAPLLLEQTEAFVQIYPDDKDINEKAMKLYIALLVMIEAIIKWFDHGFLERLKVIVQQDMYGHKIEEKQAHLDACVQQLRTRADLCDKQHTADIARAIKENIEKSDELMALLKDVSTHMMTSFHLVIQKEDDNLAASTELARSVSAGFRSQTEAEAENLAATQRVSRDLSDGFSGVRVDMDSFASRIEKTVMAKLNEVSTRELAMNAVAAQFSAQQQLFEWQVNAMQRMMERNNALEYQLQATNLELQRALTPPPGLSQGQVVEILGHALPNATDLGATGARAQQYIQMARRLDESPELTEAVMSDPRFHTWMGTAASQWLFVSPDAPLSAVSPGSFVSASLAMALGQMRHAFALCHFCGRDEGYAGADPAGVLLASLVYQLLIIRQYDGQEWSSIALRPEQAQALYERHVPTLCGLLQRLIVAIPVGMVFCVIDDFYRLEDDAPRDSLRAVVSTLSEIVYTRNVGGRGGFKALAMTPDYKGTVVPFVNDEDFLRILVSHRRGKHSDLTPKQLEWHLDRAENGY